MFALDVSKASASCCTHKLIKQKKQVEKNKRKTKNSNFYNVNTEEKNLHKLEEIQDQLKKLEKMSKSYKRRLNFGTFMWLSPFVLIGLLLHASFQEKRKKLNQSKKKKNVFDRRAKKSILKSEKKVIQIRTSGIRDSVSELGNALLDEDTISFANLLTLIRKAAKDENVLGVSLVLEEGSTIGLAKTQEIAKELIALKNKDKFVLAYGKTVSMRDFVLTSFCDGLYLQPTAVLNLCGLAFPGVFFKGLLDKLGIVPFVVKRERYKSAMDPFITDAFSKEYREEMETLGKDLHQQCLLFIANRLQSPLQRAQEIVDNAPYISDEAIAEGLADGEMGWSEYEIELAKMCYSRKQVHKDDTIAYISPRQYLRLIQEQERWRKTLQLIKNSQGEAGVEDSSTLAKAQTDDVVLSSLPQSSSTSQTIRSDHEKVDANSKTNVSDNDKKKIIALINMSGPIVTCYPLFSFSIHQYIFECGSDTIQKLVTTAANTPDVVGIVLRIDSPGGDAVASESIWDAVNQARQTGKPIVASMGDVCASGGYYVACAANKIVASPVVNHYKKKILLFTATITGSIGVIMGSFSIGQMLKKIGITYETIKFGENSDYLNIFEYPSVKAQERTDVQLDKMYDTFLKRVAKGRNMTKEQVREVAQGRVWTGVQGRANGLVDELGGLYHAKKICEELAKVEPEDTKFVKFVGRAEAMFDLIDLWSDFGVVSKVIAPIHHFMSMTHRIQHVFSESQCHDKPQFLWSPLAKTMTTV
ncbi:signal peptide peptidase SppA, 36K type [Reticulomyxa filosa]|uniref:Signal peptide peptidase SppA, 36K type n=1 Tax=Reticulomyxa filosa TaxID=46433 RepID=X6NXF6_RETFI|nr:signal peptide peptidase SppA, 36K type [Reticulomyxa filosa]|eukprot:ETO30504.1 signal peptide peptidase SppA, 36K type [Reticulomyxa filosa]